MSTILIFVNDIIIIASSEALLQQIIVSLHQKFSMTDLGSLNYFLSISVTRPSGMFLSQRKYAFEILERAYMVNCNPSQTPIDIESNLGDDGDPYNMFVFICTILGSLISQLLNGYRGMFVYADIFTKGLPSALFEEFHISLSVRRLLALTAGEC
nr:ribonuclease H-like domain-containing protein [Tanacetum cinerariifolium]